MNAASPQNERATLRIVAADDSAVMRTILRTIFAMHAADTVSTLPRMELTGLVSNGVEALEAVERLRPDLLVLDLEMPQMGGLAVLDRLRASSPALPVIICSAHTAQGAQTTLDALRRGANDYVLKPSQQSQRSDALCLLKDQLLPRIAAFAKARTSLPPAPADRVRTHAPAQGLLPPIGSLLQPARGGVPVELVVIGVSTGGPSALEQLLPMLPADLPVPVMIVQHMPKLFTRALADRLDKLCRLRVSEAADGQSVLPSTVLLAPGDAHLEIYAAAPGLGGKAQARLHQGPALNSCKPAVDYLFQSAARLYGAGTLAVILTGMGSDGVDGARAVGQAGGTVLAQDEASSAVWGMPGRVSREGIATATLPLRSLAAVIVQRIQESRAALLPAMSAAQEAVHRREVSYGMF